MKKVVFEIMRALWNNFFDMHDLRERQRLLDRRDHYRWFYHNMYDMLGVSLLGAIIRGSFIIKYMKW